MSVRGGEDACVLSMAISAFYLVRMAVSVRRVLSRVQPELLQSPYLCHMDGFGQKGLGLKACHHMLWMHK